MSNPYKLPSYRHVEVNGQPVRAYLVLSADIHGMWSASYHAWLGEDDEGRGQYAVVPPIVSNQPDMKSALRGMNSLLKHAQY